MSNTATTNSSTPPVVLTIAGSDPSGGAGIQADLRTFASLGAHGASAITALTIQNTLGTTAINAVEANVVAAQIDAVLEDLSGLDPGLSAVKSGMLATAEIVEVVARRAEQGLLRNLVLDPVLVASTGESLAEIDLASAIRDVLLPHCFIITPNASEATALLGWSVENESDARRAAKELVGLGCTAAFVTGISQGNEITDVLHLQGEAMTWSGQRIETQNDHGTGCIFSAALAAHLGAGLDIPGAVDASRKLVRDGLRIAMDWNLGLGRGPFVAAI